MFNIVLDARSSGQRELDKTNLLQKRLYMNNTFLDPRLSPVNCSIVPNASVCTDVVFVVVVHVRAEDAQTRNTWRSTYGDRHLRDEFNYTLIFSVGKPKSANNQKIIEEESNHYGDILQTDFEDSYRNLTYKHLAELRYLASVCDDNVIILKLDDDVAWDVLQASKFTEKVLKSNGVHCMRRDGHQPFRDPKSKWVATKEEWNETVYPPHCLGWCYFTPVSAVKRMLSVAHRQRFFWIDDIFITGVLRKAAKVKITNTNTIGNEDHPKKPPKGKIVFLTTRGRVRHWFFIVNHERLANTSSESTQQAPKAHSTIKSRRSTLSMKVAEVSAKVQDGP